MTLRVDGRDLPVSQVGGGMIYFHHEVSLPPRPSNGSRECLLTMAVDGQMSEWDVLLGDHPLLCSAVAAEFRFRGQTPALESA